MQVSEYLQDELENCTNYQLTDFDKNLLEKEGIEAFIFNKLSSKKFRKYKMEEACSDRTKHAIALRVAKNEPIHVIFPQGGYKLWRLPSTPTVDWAEFFSIAYCLSYIAPIAAAYKPGVTLTFYMHTLLMEKHDNLTSEEIAAYVDSFQKLLTQFSQYIPVNISLAISRDADLYTRDEYFAQLESGKIIAEKIIADWPEEKISYFKRMSSLNIKWNGREDWTQLTEKEKEEKIYLSALYETAAVYHLEKVKKIIKAPDNILIFTIATHSHEFIAIGSTKTSVAKYWVGTGVLEKTASGFQDRILTPSQLASTQALSHEKVAIINQPNFQDIAIYPQLNFSNHKS